MEHQWQPPHRAGCALHHLPTQPVVLGPEASASPGCLLGCSVSAPRETCGIMPSFSKIHAILIHERPGVGEMLCLHTLPATYLPDLTPSVAPHCPGSSPSSCPHSSSTSLCCYSPSTPATQASCCCSRNSLSLPTSMSLHMLWALLLPIILPRKILLSKT